MDRRVFIKDGAIAGAAAASIPWLQSCRPAGREKSPEGFITDEFEIKEESILQLQKYLEAGKYTSEKLVELYLARIQKIDKSGPVLNSVIEINPDASEIARQLDQERKSGKVRSPLHGIPVMIKDNIETSDRMLTTAGSLALTYSPALQDAFIVKKLREAGAVSFPLPTARIPQARWPALFQMLP